MTMKSKHQHMFSTKNCYFNLKVHNSYCNFKVNNKKKDELLRQVGHHYYVSPTFFNSLLLVKSVSFLYRELHRLTNLHEDHSIVQIEWIKLWNHNFFNTTTCIDKFHSCCCSFHRYQRWNSTKDSSLIITQIESIFWANRNFFFTNKNLKMEDYSLDPDSFVNLYFSKEKTFLK